MSQVELGSFIGEARSERALLLERASSRTGEVGARLVAQRLETAEPRPRELAGPLLEPVRAGRREVYV